MSTDDDHAPAPEQSFIEHLSELRDRLLRAIAIVVILFIALIPFARRIYAWLAEPLLSRLPDGGQLISIEVTGPFLIPIKAAFFVAVVIAMPAVLYQLWAFVAPALYRHEKRLALPLLVSAVLLFYAGCAFAYFLVMPVVFGFITAMTPEGVMMMTDISRYLDFSLMLFLAFGLCFEVPVATVLIVATGWLSLEQLQRSRPYVIVAAFVIAAIFTPPDVPSQLMMAGSMCLLYEVGLVAARWLAPGKNRNAGSDASDQA